MGDLSFVPNACKRRPQLFEQGALVTCNRAHAAGGTSDETVVQLTVTDQMPVATADWYKVGHGQSLSTTANDGVLANDWDPHDVGTLSAQLVTSVTPSNAGTLTLNDDGSFNFDASNSFEGNATFTYQAANAVAHTNPITVTIDVTDSTPSAVAGSQSL